jgi:outer membrane protein
MKTNFTCLLFSPHFIQRTLILVVLLIINTVWAASDKLTEPLLLSEVIEIALANNPDIAAKTYEQSVADARYDMTFSSRLPHVNLYSSFGRYHEDRMIAPRRPGDGDTLQFTDQPLSGDVVVHMPLFTGGRLVNETRAAKLLYTASGHQLNRNREELVFNISSVFYSILAQRHIIESFEFSQKALEEHCSQIQKMISVQKATNDDLLRTEVRLSALQCDLTRAKNILAIQNRLLTNLMGMNYTTNNQVMAAGELKPGDDTVPEIESSLNKAFIQRPDYLAVQDILSARKCETDAAKAQRSPSVSLKGVWGNQWDTHDFDQNNEAGSIMLEVEIPIFNGGYISAQVREKRAIQFAASEKLRQLELKIQLDVETAVLNINSSVERLRATGKSIEQAKESLRIESEKHIYAKGSVTDLLDAQSDLLEAQMNYYSSLSDYKIAHAQYRLAIGESF